MGASTIYSKVASLNKNMFSISEAGSEIIELSCIVWTVWDKRDFEYVLSTDGLIFACRWQS